MKKVFIMLSIVAAIFMISVPQSMAMTVTVHWYNGLYMASNEGEFNLLPSDDLKNMVLYLYSPETKNQINRGSFESFCIEKSEFIAQGGTYNATISDKAIWGGVGPEGDPISIGTAWLYHQFQSSELEGYDYIPGAGRAHSARLLQETIWWLEGELAKPDNIFTDAVIAMFGSEAGAKADNLGRIGVGVLNLTDMTTGGRIQDQLVCLPAPEPTSLLLFGCGLIGLAGLSRKFKK